MEDQEGMTATDLLWIVPFAVVVIIVIFCLYQGVRPQPRSENINQDRYERTLRDTGDGRAYDERYQQNSWKAIINESTRKKTTGSDIKEQQKLKHRQAYIESLQQFYDAVIDLENGIEIGVNLTEYVSKTNNLANAYSRIRISPEMQLYADYFHYIDMIGKYPDGSEEKKYYISLAKESWVKCEKEGDEDGYGVYQTAQIIRQSAVAVAEFWNYMVRNATNVLVQVQAKESRDRHLKYLLDEIARFKKRYTKYVNTHRTR